LVKADEDKKTRTDNIPNLTQYCGILKHKTILTLSFFVI